MQGLPKGSYKIWPIPQSLRYRPASKINRQGNLNDRVRALHVRIRQLKTSLAMAEMELAGLRLAQEGIYGNGTEHR